MRCEGAVTVTVILRASARGVALSLALRKGCPCQGWRPQCVPSLYTILPHITYLHRTYLPQFPSFAEFSRLMSMSRKRIHCSMRYVSTTPYHLAHCTLLSTFVGMVNEGKRPVRVMNAMCIVYAPHPLSSHPSAIQRKWVSQCQHRVKCHKHGYCRNAERDRRALPRRTRPCCAPARAPCCFGGSSSGARGFRSCA